MEDSGFDLKIAIIGLGLIGGSYAMALKELNPQKIYGIDNNESTLKKALQLGIIDSAYVEGKIALKEADLVIIALYPHETIKFIQENIDNFKRGAIITDTCGVKKEIVEKISCCLPEYVDFIAAHPMAGKEAKGLSHASKDIFKNSNYIITPTKRNKLESIKTIEKMARAMGCKKVVSITPEEHDRIISFTSQLPHVIAISLMNSHLKENNIELFSGGSLKDATRVADINSELWYELFKLNSENLIYEIEKFEESIQEVKRAINSDDKFSLINLFEEATKKRRKMVCTCEH